MRTTNAQSKVYMHFVKDPENFSLIEGKEKQTHGVDLLPADKSYNVRNTRGASNSYTSCGDW
jgi:hypothetical protein